MSKITSESSAKRGRINDYKNSFVITNFVSIDSTPTSSISDHTKHIDFFISLININYLKKVI